MDLQHVRAFVYVAHEGNLKRAAERLHLTQSAVSVQLKTFQQMLGLSLLARSPAGLALTADGRELLPLAEAILAGVRVLEKRAASMQDSLRGDLRIGTTLNPEVTRLGAFLRVIHTLYPQVKTRLHHGMSGDIRELLLKGALDVCYYVGDAGESMQDPALHAQPLTVFTHYVIAPRGWRDRVQGRGWAELAALPWIWAPPQSVHNRLLSARFTEAGVTPMVVAEVDVEASMLDMVRSGIGLALAREPVALRESETNGLVVLKNLPLPSQLSFLVLHSRKEEPLSRAALEAVTSVFQE